MLSNKLFYLDIKGNSSFYNSVIIINIIKFS